MSNNHTLLLLCLACIPAVAGGIACIGKTYRRIASFAAAGIGAGSLLGCIAIVQTSRHGIITGFASWLYLDALSSFNLAVMIAVYVMSSAYAFVYFKEERRASHLSLRQARQFAGLWCGAFSSMTLALISNNLGIMWVGIEATTLLTAFLICIHSTRQSLEAMWKYLLICSVGVAFAFLGTLLAAASSRTVPGLDMHQALLWTRLRDHATMLNPALIKAAFIFLVVGYGTKAGLAPMHNWLPDAHSQAPSPVSALFSGFMLNAALYCIMRYLPIVETATGHRGWATTLLAFLGVFSIGIGAAFIVFQHDVKRLLAYCSVEHIGIIALGLGLGGFGVFAALFLIGVSVVFVGMLSKAIPLMWGDPAVSTVTADNHSWLEIGLAVVPLAALLALGCWMPGFLGSAMTLAAEIIRTGSAAAGR